MTNNIYLLLGLPEDATWTEVKQAYARLNESLSQTYACEDTDPTAKELLKSAQERMNQCFERLKANKSSRKLESFCHPKLGQLLVAAGILSIEELESYLEIQRNTNNEHIPLGKLLIASGYLTPEQLNYYLRAQQVMQLPPDHPERWGQRLVELGIVTEDQLKVALIDQQATGCTLREAFINRGWTNTTVLDRIF